MDIVKRNGALQVRSIKTEKLEVAPPDSRLGFRRLFFKVPYQNALGRRYRELAAQFERQVLDSQTKSASRDGATLDQMLSNAANDVGSSQVFD